MMNNDIFAVAAGKTADMKKMKEALLSMYCFEFFVDEYTDKNAVLYAKSYTEDLETAKRRPYVIKAAEELANKYQLTIIPGYYEGYQSPATIEVEKYKTFEEALEKADIDAVFSKSSGQMGA